MQPKISIITATRNAIQHLPGLADSILRQPQELVEWVVIDGESDDGTVEFLRSIQDPKLTWISEADDGIYDAWNKAVGRARGRWVMFLGADDHVEDAWLQACAAAPDVDLVYGDLEIRDAGGDFLARVPSGPWEVVKRDMKIRMMLPHPGLAHNKALFASRRFDPSFKIAGDFHFLAGASIRSAAQVPAIQVVMRLGGVSNRPERVNQAFRENLRVLHEYGSVLQLRDRARWLLKRACAISAPGFFLALQKFSWRMRRRL